MSKSEAWVIMLNDFPESVALTEEAAQQAVTALRTKFGEPAEGERRRYIRAEKVPVVQEHKLGRGGRLGMFAVILAFLIWTLVTLVFAWQLGSLAAICVTRFISIFIKR